MFVPYLLAPWVCTPRIVVIGPSCYVASSHLLELMQIRVLNFIVSMLGERGTNTIETTFACRDVLQSPFFLDLRNEPSLPLLRMTVMLELIDDLSFR